MADPVSANNSSLSPTPYELFVGTREKLSEECLKAKELETRSQASGAHGEGNLGVDLLLGTAGGALTFGAVTEIFNDIYGRYSVWGGEASHHFAQVSNEHLKKLADQYGVCGDYLNQRNTPQVAALNRTFVKLVAAGSTVPAVLGAGDFAGHYLYSSSEPDPFAALPEVSSQACAVLQDSMDVEDGTPDLGTRIQTLKDATLVVQTNNTQSNVDLAGKSGGSDWYYYARVTAVGTGVAGAAFGPGARLIHGMYDANIRRPFFTAGITEPLKRITEQAQKAAETEFKGLVRNGTLNACGDQNKLQKVYLEDFLKEPETAEAAAEAPEAPTTERSFMGSLTPVILSGVKNPVVDLRSFAPLRGLRMTEGMMGLVENVTRMPSWLRLPSLEPAYAIAGGGGFSSLRMTESNAVYRATPNTPAVDALYGHSGGAGSSSESQAAGKPGSGTPIAIGVLGTVTVGLNALAREWNVSQEKIDQANGIAALFLLLSSVALAQKDLLKLGKLVEFAKMLPATLAEQLPAVLLMMMGSQVGRQQFAGLSEYLGWQGERANRMEDVGTFIAGPLEGWGVYKGLQYVAQGFEMAVVAPIMASQAAASAGEVENQIYDTIHAQYADALLPQAKVPTKDESLVGLSSAEKDLFNELDGIFEEALYQNNNRTTYQWITGIYVDPNLNELIDALYDPRYTQVLQKHYDYFYGRFAAYSNEYYVPGRGVTSGSFDQGQPNNDSKLERLQKNGALFVEAVRALEVSAVSPVIEEPKENFLQTGNSLGSEESVCSTEEEVSYVSSVVAQGFDIQPSDISDTSELLESSECYDVQFPQSFEDDVFVLVKCN